MSLAKGAAAAVLFFAACHNTPSPSVVDPLHTVSLDLFAMEIQNRVLRDTYCGIVGRFQQGKTLSEFERHSMVQCEAMRYIVDVTAPVLADVRRSRRVPAMAFVFTMVAGDEEDEIGPFPDLPSCKHGEDLLRRADVATKRCVPWRHY